MYSEVLQVGFWKVGDGTSGNRNPHHRSPAALCGSAEQGSRAEGLDVA
jgi:hypothetical protein